MVGFKLLLFFKNKGFDCYGFDPAPEAVEYGKKGIKFKTRRIRWNGCF